MSDGIFGVNGERGEEWIEWMERRNGGLLFRSQLLKHEQKEDGENREGKEGTGSYRNNEVIASKSSSLETYTRHNLEAAYGPQRAIYLKRTG